MRARVAIVIGLACVASSAWSGCALFRSGGRYAARDKSCVVTMLPRAPERPVDDLGIITVDCWAGHDDECEQEVLDEACHRGGDVVWGLGSTAPSTSKIAVHVARTRQPAAVDAAAPVVARDAAEAVDARQATQGGLDVSAAAPPPSVQIR